MKRSSQSWREGSTPSLVLAPRTDTPRSTCLASLFDEADSHPPLIGVTYDRPADRFVDDWRESVGAWPKNASLIVVGESTRSTATQSSVPRSRIGTPIRCVERPEDLSALYDALDDALDEWSFASRQSAPVVYFDSLTDLTSTVDLETAIAFVDDVSTLVCTSGATGYFVVYRDADDVTVAALASQFDDVVDVDDEGRRHHPCSRPAERSWPVPDVVAHTAVSTGRVDELLETLAPHRRRSVLSILDHLDAPTTVQELSRHVATRESNEEPPSTHHLTRVHTSLRHVHLPKLADCGLVTLDHDTVDLADEYECVQPLFATIDHLDERG